MPNLRPDFDEQLLKAASQLDAALGRLKGMLGASLGCLLAVEAWSLWRGPAAVPEALTWGLLAWVAVNTLYWQAACRRLTRWTRAADLRLGPGSGRALLGLGRYQGSAAPLKAPPLPAVEPVQIKLGAWAGPALLALGVALPLAWVLRAASAALALVCAVGAQSLGELEEKA